MKFCGSHRWMMVLALGCASLAPAAEPSPPAGGHQPVPLPYSFHDGQGMQWDILPDSTIGPGNADVFDSGAKLMIGAVQYSPSAAQAQFDPAQNELIFPEQTIGSVIVSRRISVNVKENWLRFVEVFENPTASAQKISPHVAFQMGQQIESAQVVGDGTRADKPLGLAVFDTQRGLAFLGAGRGSRITTTFAPQPGGNMVEIVYDPIEIPPHQKAALVHVEAVRGTRNDAQSLLQRATEKQVLAGLPADLVRRVVNFGLRGATFVDRDILRDDLLDIVELRAGDQYKGTLKETQYSLKTSFGQIDLPASRVIALFSIGDYRPYQLIVTGDGEAFSGSLQSAVIHMELSSGQITPIPLASIQRLGYRRRPGEPEEWKTTGPVLILRTGDRLRVQLPLNRMVISTRYGRLELKPQMIASLAFQSDEQPVHEILLTDGSKFAGLVEPDPLRLTLVGTSTGAAIDFPAAGISRLQLAPAREFDEQSAALVLSTSDRLVGSLTGMLTLDTAFDALELNGGEIRAIVQSPNSPAEVQVTMWEGAILSGRLRANQIEIALDCGATLKVPVALIDRYAQPFPLPSKPIRQKVSALVAELNADDEARTKRAMDELSAMGKPIAGGLKSVRDAQPQVVRERIGRILAEFDTPSSPSSPPPEAGTNPAGANPPQQNHQ